MRDAKVIQEAKIKGMLLGYDFSALLRIYKKEEMLIPFLQGVLELLEKDNFLYLDDEKRESLGYFLDAVILRNADNEEIRRLRGEIFAKIKAVRGMPYVFKEKLLDQNMQNERKLRHIPDQVNLTRDDLVSFFQVDYQNLVQIRVMDYDLSNCNIDLFSFLSTINRMLEVYPQIFSERSVRIHIKFIIKECLRLKKYNKKHAFFIATYSYETLNLIEDYEKKMSSSQIISIAEVKQMKKTLAKSN